MNMGLNPAELAAPLTDWDHAYFAANDAQRKEMLAEAEAKVVAFPAYSPVADVEPLTADAPDSSPVANLSVAPIAFEAEEPLPIMPERQEAAPFPMDALGPLRVAAEAAARITNAPEALAAQSALAVAATIVQVFSDVETLGGGSAPVSLFLLTVAASGERKSSTEKRLTVALGEWEKDARKKAAQAYGKFKIAGKAWEAKQNGLLASVKKGGPEAVAAEAALGELEPRPAPPGDPTRLVTEPTFEGLTNLLAKSPHKSLGLLAAEGGQFLGGHAMNKDNRQKTVSAFSLLWDGDPIKRTRAAEGETKAITDARFSMCLQVQPVIAEELLNDPLAQGQGFLARFLIVQPESTIGTRTLTGSKEEKQAQEMAKLDLDNFRIQALNLLMENGRRSEDGAERGLLSLSYQAENLLRDFYNRTEEAQAKGGWLAGHTAVASKIAEQACRLAGVMALWANPNAQEIGAETMRDAITLAEFYLGEAVRLGSIGAMPQADREAEELRVWLFGKWQELAAEKGRDPALISSRDLSCWAPSQLRVAATYKAALNKLIAHGWVTRCDAGTVVDGKPRKEAYRIRLE